MIPIYIPSLGRKRLCTLELMSPALREHVTVVTNRAQVAAVSAAYGVRAVACPHTVEPGEPRADGITKGISPTRQWIVDNCPTAECIMCDDDLTFWIRKNRDTMEEWPVRKTTVEEVTELFEDMSNLVGKYAVVGLSARQGNNRLNSRLLESKRMWNVWGVDIAAMRSLNIKFTAVPTMQDFWLQLSFLSAGYPTAMICDRMHNQSASNAPGGCSLFRNHNTQHQSIQALLKRFPEFISVRQAKTKGGWFGEETPRLDITFLGRKAFEHGRSIRRYL